MGRLAVEMLLELLRNRPGVVPAAEEGRHRVRLPTHLVLRDSSGPART